jgi:hypothetical protein
MLFRGFLYRISVNYLKVDTRNNITLNDKKLIKEIDNRTRDRILSIEEIIELSNKITSEKLDFTFNKVTSNPNLVCKLEKANCIGYSSLFNSIGNHIVEKQNLTEKYEFKHLVGKLEFFGLDIHKLFNSPFFKDHDFNEIRNKQTNEKKYVDPSLRDYLRIENVRSE